MVFSKKALTGGFYLTDEMRPTEVNTIYVDFIMLLTY